MSLLEDITSRDPRRIWTSSCAIRTLRDREELALLADQIDNIRESTNNIPLGGAMRSNSTHLDFAIKKLEFIKSSTNCLCCLYLLDDMYNPVQEEQQGNIRILGTTLIGPPPGRYIDYYECECTICNAKYRVEEREYHYTWWSWRRA
jgi:hypothetical protein